MCFGPGNLPRRQEQEAECSTEPGLHKKGWIKAEQEERCLEGGKES